MDGAPGPKVTLKCLTPAPEGPIPTITQLQGIDAVSPLFRLLNGESWEGLGQESAWTHNQRVALGRGRAVDLPK